MTIHGLPVTYAVHGCRCVQCRDAARRDRAQRRIDTYLRGPKHIDATGARRRLQALVALGHTLLSLTGPTGLGRRNLASIAYGEQTEIHRDRAAAIARVYDQLSDTTPNGSYVNGRARRLAAAKRWAPPIAWDDDTIDDPAAQPACLTGPTQRSSADTATEVAHLRSYGLTDETIAERLGIKLNSMLKALDRAAA